MRTTNKPDLDTDLAHAGTIQNCKEELTTLLTRVELRTKKGPLMGSELHKKTFEDHAREVAGNKDDPRAEQVSKALSQFQAAVNAFWAHLYDQRVAEKLYSYWSSKNPRLARKVRHMKDDGYCEVVMKLRELILAYKLGSATFKVFATIPVCRHLTQWATRESSKFSGVEEELGEWNEPVCDPFGTLERSN